MTAEQTSGTRLTTVEQLRELRASKTPMFRVVFLPYIEGLDPETGEKWPCCRRCGYSHGGHEDIYTDQAEATHRYEALRASPEHIEVATLELFEVVYPRTGGWANTILREKGQ